MHFTGYTLSSLGERFRRRQHNSDRLPRPCVELFGDMLTRHPRVAGLQRLEEMIDAPKTRHLSVSFISEDATSGRATFWRHYCEDTVPLSVSMMLRGANREQEQKWLSETRGLVAELFERQGTLPVHAELPFDTETLAQRPLLASVVTCSRGECPLDLQLVSEMELCLAAAFFEREAARCETQLFS